MGAAGHRPVTTSVTTNRRSASSCGRSAASRIRQNAPTQAATTTCQSADLRVWVGGRYWDRTSDLLGVNESPRGRYGSLTQVSGRSRSLEVDVVRCSCCTLLLHNCAKRLSRSSARNQGPRRGTCAVLHDSACSQGSEPPRSPGRSNGNSRFRQQASSPAGQCCTMTLAAARDDQFLVEQDLYEAVAR
jgi:hypothetical protein